MEGIGYADRTDCCLDMPSNKRKIQTHSLVYQTYKNKRGRRIRKEGGEVKQAAVGERQQTRRSKCQQILGTS